MSNEGQQSVFRDLSADDPDPEVTQIESMCMNCHGNGETRVMMTRIPYYKNVVVMSFTCDECGYENNEIQPGGAFAEKGIKWTLRVEEASDLNRQVVKSDYTCIKIPEIQLEMPAQSQKGEVTTVEGIVSRAIMGLQQDQEARYVDHPEAAEKIADFIVKFEELKRLQHSWTLEMEDISGNTFIENPFAPRRDPRCDSVEFTRTTAQDHMLGIYQSEELAEHEARSPEPSLLTAANPEEHTYEKLQNDEIMSFNTNCPDCNAPANTNMKLTKIPHFKEVIIMATNCDACGHRTNEVKSGGGVEDRGVRFELRVANEQDFSRDILKSETCSMEIPELELEVGGRALGGRFTTAEGVLRATLEQLADAPGVLGDAPGLNRAAMDSFIQKVDLVLEGKMPVTIVLDDPAGNSYVQSLADDPSQPDDGLKITHYERSFEQREELGLNDMKTEDYEPNR